MCAQILIIVYEYQLVDKRKAKREGKRNKMNLNRDKNTSTIPKGKRFTSFTFFFTLLFRNLEANREKRMFAQFIG